MSYSQHLEASQDNPLAYLPLCLLPARLVVPCGEVNPCHNATSTVIPVSFVNASKAPSGGVKELYAIRVKFFVVEESELHEVLKNKSVATNGALITTFVFFMSMNLPCVVIGRESLDRPMPEHLFQC